MLTTTVRDRYWDRVVHNDGAGARAIVDAVLADGTPLAGVLTDLVGDAQRRVGSLWAADEWSVAREHAATAVNEQVVQHLRCRTRGARSGSAGRTARSTAPLLVVCAEREWHALPALMLTARLEEEGHAVAYLGADVSTLALQRAIADHEPRATLVSASLASSLVFVRRHVETSTASGVPVVVGGAAFDAGGLRSRRLGITAQALDPADVGDLLAYLPRRVPAVAPLRTDAAREAFALLAAIDTHTDVVSQRVARRGGSGTATVLDQVPHVLGSLAAALLTDDPSIVGETRAWLDAVGDARHCDPGTLEELWAAITAQVADYPRGRRMLADAA
ncbi:methanogenic corrinoid protein MtbC1 [Nocardioides zeae]|uniref:Methanogenic corrinoid protein MtbC1 n=1 Tax=Nocardioides zeae TaxID=1457234 RepID=A0ACC6IDG4_9ACTN|nr:cobalamin B12-binding domain-containing protein [Nocardioides zeae]MDR6175762.1 methanogenic corrinoid protein MtbC1 [Nocardioides zeae]MDR6208690.1 methanogenic corrinoid protein MtbC1 [Nocardioides zeae]